MTVCRDIQSKLTAYLEGDLTPEEKGPVDAHLACCPMCKTALVDLKKTTGLVQGLEDVEPPPWLTRKIMTLVREEDEQRVSIIRRLFYPLRVKIPIQAFATLLVVVLGVYVYKATGPEIKMIQPPPAAEKAITLPEASKKTAKAGSQVPPSAEESVRQQIRERENKASPPRPIPEKALPAEQKIDVRQETKAQKIEEAPRVSTSLRGEHAASGKQAAAPPMPFVKDKDSFGSVSSGMEEKHETLEAVPPSKLMYAGKPAPITLTLRVKDVQSAPTEVVRLVGQLGGTGTATESIPSGALLTTVLPARNFTIFLERLARLGILKEKAPRTGLPEGNVFLRIEISGDS